MARSAKTTRKPSTEAAKRGATTGDATKAAGGASDARVELSDDELRGLIAETAYYKAEQRGFEPGYEQRDWLEAEAEVMDRLGMRP